jgi:hypothetical protein
MQELLIRIFFYIGILLLIVSMVSVFLYSHGMTATRKAIYMSSVFMMLGFIAWGVAIFFLKPAMMLYFLLAGGGITGIYLIAGIVSLALRDKMFSNLAQRRKRKQ